MDGRTAVASFSFVLSFSAILLFPIPVHIHNTCTDQIHPSFPNFSFALACSTMLLYIQSIFFLFSFLVTTEPFSWIGSTEGLLQAAHASRAPLVFLSRTNPAERSLDSPRSDAAAKLVLPRTHGPHTRLLRTPER